MAAGTAALRIRLLGGLQVEGWRPAEVGSRKARTLLAALALSPGPVAADALADWLWSSSPPSRPADQVGVLVSRLRGALGARRIVRIDAGYALDADWIDLAELADRAAAAERHLAAGDLVSARLAATMALDLARGSLLPEEDGAWVEPHRTRAGRLVASVGLVAAQAALRSGDALGAAAAAASALDHDPYDEAALRALMRAHVGAGRPASALSVYADARARLAADLGVSPDARTEALHAEVLGLEEAPSVPDRFDPLVQRARVELATNDLSAARRDADEAVRRGGGPAAMEMAGWVAYYCRDFPAALRWAEDAVAGAADPERRASASALAGRIRHSFGDLAEAERRLATARESSVAGVREMGEVWLGSLRAHQGRPAEALAHAERGATDAAALRHPFAISHALLAQVYALGMQGRVADVLARLDVWDRTLDDLGPLGARYRPAGLNFRAWVAGAIGRDTEARAHSEAAIEHAEGLSEARTHAVLDLARLAVDADDGQEATRVLDGLEVAEDRTGTMAWHQRQRLGTIRAQIHLLAGEPLVAEELASAVARDAGARGARRAEVLADAVVLEASARGRGSWVPGAAEDLLDRLGPVAGLERWRVAARLAASSGDEAIWARAERWGRDLAAASGVDEAAVAAWVEGELSAPASVTRLAARSRAAPAEGRPPAERWPSPPAGPALRS